MNQLHPLILEGGINSGTDAVSGVRSVGAGKATPPTLVLTGLIPASAAAFASARGPGLRRGRFRYT